MDWLLTGDEDRKDFPADKAMVNWLWQHPEVREELWKQMKEKSDWNTLVLSSRMPTLYNAPEIHVGWLDSILSHSFQTEINLYFNHICTLSQERKVNEQ